MAPDTRAPYEVISQIYDKWVTHMRYDLMAKYIISCFPQGATDLRCLDLCCGTGTLAVHLGSTGVQVWGLDRSGPMLEVARRKIQAARLEHRVRLSEMDVMAEEWPKGPFDLVVCTSDSVNYFAPADLSTLFRRVALALQPNASFIFDINTPHKLRDVFGDTTYAETRDDYCYIWKNELDLDRHSVSFQIDLFLPVSTQYSRYREVHRQYYLEIDEIAGMLAKEGLDIAQCHDEYELRMPDNSTLRLVFHVRPSTL